MTLNEYQEKAMSTCMDSCYNFSYMMLNLVGEVGELSSKVAKMIRKGKFEIGVKSNLRVYIKAMGKDDFETFDKELKLEAGDIAWQLAGLCSVLGWSLEEVCQANLDKLASRKARGVIDGNGDER
jgi:NTP pyrophosphatase (non-canonical NTP hydrolase)